LENNLNDVKEELKEIKGNSFFAAFERYGGLLRITNKAERVTTVAKELLRYFL
jgi:hypothetical protein